MLTIFTKHPRVLNMRGFQICQGSKYTKALNMPLVLNLPRLWWINQASEYVTLNRVLNMPEYAWLNMHGYFWICQYLRAYAQICLNGFCFIFPYCNALSPWTRAYLFQRLHKTRSFRLKENDAVFFETQTLIFL